MNIKQSEVDLALERMEIDDERQKEALRKFLERDRYPAEVTGKQILWWFCKVVFWAAVIALVVVGAMAL